MSLFSSSRTQLVALALVAAASPYLMAAAAPQALNQIQVPSQVPSGTILPFGGDSAPAGYLLCDGTEVQRSMYPKLFAAVGSNFGAATAFTFTLPDLRGRFLRGVDGAANNDPDHNSRTASGPGGTTGNGPGSLQGDARRGISGTVSGSTSINGAHAHGITTYQDDFDEDDGNGSSAAPGWADDATATSAHLRVAVTTTDAAHGHTFNVFASFAGDNETRPKNVYVNYIVKI
jgi:microcystin-dependent protein